MQKLFSFQCLIDILGKRHLWKRQRILPRLRLCVLRRGAPRCLCWRSDLLAPKAAVLSPSPPHPTSSSRRFGELNRRESCGAAGRMGAELSLWQRGHFGEFCTERCLFIGKESCVSLQSPLRGRDCPHPYGSCQHHPSSCQKEHWALNFPLGISPPPFSFLRPPPKTAAIAHTRSSKAALNYLKAQQVF